MGMLVSVYRADRQDCTNGGISANFKQLCVVNIDGPFEPDIHIPAAILTINQLGDPILKPARKDFGCDWVEQPGWFMMGGNFAYTSDSRFSEAVRKYAPGFYGAIPIHDRQE